MLVPDSSLAQQLLFCIGNLSISVGLGVRIWKQYNIEPLPTRFSASLINLQIYIFLFLTHWGRFCLLVQYHCQELTSASLALEWKNWGTQSDLPYLLAWSVLHGDQFQHLHHDRCSELLLNNTSNLSVCCYLQKLLSTHLSISREKTLMTLWGYRSSQYVPQWLHWLLPWFDVQVWTHIIFLVPGSTEISQSMLGTSSINYGLVSQSTHWYTLWVGHTYPRNFTQDTSPSHSIWITTFLVFITISAKSSSTGIHTVVITATDISGYQDNYMLPVIPWLVETPINLTGGRIINGKGFSAPILYFDNKTTGWWSATYFTMAECATKDTSVDELSTSFYTHDSVALFYRERMSHSYIILAGRCHITNWYCNNSVRHLCTTWGTLASDSKNFCSPLQDDSNVNYDPHNYFLNFPMDHLNADTYPTKLCLDFSSGYTVDHEMK